MEIKETLQQTLNLYLPKKSKLEPKEKTITRLSSPTLGLYSTLLSFLVISAIIIFVQLYFDLHFFTVNPSYWQSFVNTGWTVHSSILAISITLIIFLVQVTGVNASQRVIILNEFAKKSLLYPTLYWALLGVISWGVTAAYATNPIYSDISSGLLNVSIFNSVVTIYLLIRWYKTILNVYDSQWTSQLYEKSLEENINNATRNYAIEQVINAALLIFKTNHSKKIKTEIGINKDNKLKVISSKKSGYIIDVNFDMLEKILQQFEHNEFIELHISFKNKVMKGDKLFSVSETVDAGIKSRLYKCLTISNKRLFITDNQLDNSLDSIDAILSSAIREQTIASIRHGLSIYINAINMFFEFQKKANINIENIPFQISPLDSVIRHMYKHIRSIAYQNSNDLNSEVSSLLSNLLIESFRERNLPMFKQGLKFYQYWFLYAKNQQQQAKYILERSLRITYELVWFDKDFSGDLADFNKELLSYYNNIFYHISTMNNIKLYVSVIDSLFELKYIIDERQKVDFDIKYIQYGWLFWLVFRLENKKLSIEDFNQLLQILVKGNYNKWTLFQDINQVVSNNGGREFWDEWETNEKETADDIIKLGVRTYSSDPLNLPTRSYALLSLITENGRQPSNDDSQFKPLIYRLKDVEKFAKDMVDSDYLKPMFKQEKEILINELIRFHDTVNELYEKQEANLIIKSQISQEAVIDFNNKLNEVIYRFPRDLFERFGMYIQTENKNYQKKFSRTLFMNKSLFIKKHPFIGVDNVLREFYPLLEKSIFESIQINCKGFAFNNSLAGTIDKMISKMKIDGNIPKLILVPWGTMTHREFEGNDKFTFYYNSTRTVYEHGQYNGCPILWLPEKLGNYIIIINSTNIGTWIQGVIEKAKLNVSVISLDKSTVNSIIRKRKKKGNYSAGKSGNHHKNYLQQKVLVRIETDYNYYPYEGIDGYYSYIGDYLS